MYKKTPTKRSGQNDPQKGPIVKRRLSNTLVYINYTSLIIENNYIAQISSVISSNFPASRGNNP
ncbi:hypothetical protein L21SP2_3222 [Salinispira pacifica]|uniref:Uncharacterized protein n=1 Tax=Salinispira pacifica TaxID=1307761 RepID=V5WL74_9SPIO|nr:hypothetical protein L21SP2_3222 [Salinispira pacifica]